MSSVLIKNGEIITATDRYFSDIYIENGIIKNIAPNLEKPKSETRIIDAKGHFIFPGAIDAHVHMELPFMGEISADDFETGTAAGVAGGTTTIIDFVIPSRNQPLLDGLSQWKEKAKKTCAQFQMSCDTNNVLTKSSSTSNPTTGNFLLDLF
jgi:dihydropyrimidinase